MIYYGNWQTFSVKAQIVNILDFADQASVVAVQLWGCSMETAIYNMYVNECGCVKIKLYLQKWAAGFSPRGLLLLILEYYTVNLGAVLSWW
jgi:hypothetical protein